MFKPYIGITGFTAQSEVHTALDVFPENCSHELMVGVLASQKTIFLKEKNKWPNRYPDAKDIGDIFVNSPKALNLIHYSTKELDTLANQLMRMVGIGGEYFDGFQLNMAWPSPCDIGVFRGIYPDFYIVLQIGSRAFEEVGNDPETLAWRTAKDYLGLVDYVLLDSSGGLGKPLDTEKTRLCLEALCNEGVERFMCLGVAGGLSPSTLNLVEPLVKDFPNLCIDAEGRLRNSDDHLNLNVAKEYIAKSLEIFRA